MLEGLFLGGIIRKAVAEEIENGKLPVSIIEKPLRISVSGFLIENRPAAIKNEESKNFGRIIRKAVTK